MAEANLQSRISTLHEQATKARYKAATAAGIIVGEAVSLTLGLYNSSNDSFTVFMSGVIGGYGTFQGLRSISLSNRANALEGAVEHTRLIQDPSLIPPPPNEQPLS